MDGEHKKFLRFRPSHLDSQISMGPESDFPLRSAFDIDSSKGFFKNNTSTSKGFFHMNNASGMRRGWQRSSKGYFKLGKSLRFSQVDDDKIPKDKSWNYLDPASVSLHRWNTFFLASCLVAVVIDPLFFYLPQVDFTRSCIVISRDLKIAVTVFRTLMDFVSVVHMFLRFRMAFMRPSTRFFGRGELVTNPKSIAAQYLKMDFWIDFLGVLPVPQVVIWLIIPNTSGAITRNINTKNALPYIIVSQYFPRMLRIFPLLSQRVNTTGVLLETAWAGAALNLLLYILASHVLGAGWYLLSVERQDTCWTQTCLSVTNGTKFLCGREVFDCSWSTQADWYTGLNNFRGNFTNLSNLNCNGGGGQNAFNYGIYQSAIDRAISSNVNILFFQTYFYCLWLGLLSLSSLTQTLSVSTFVGEIIFTILILIVGLLLFAFLIGSMQTYLLSLSYLTVRQEEVRVKRRQTEQWMRLRNLPHRLVQRVRRYDQYKLVATQGVDEEMLLQSLPSNLRKDIRRQLCLPLIRSVPFFDRMDDSHLDAICERLRPALCTEGTHLLRQGDPVNEMFFIIRGKLVITDVWRMPTDVWRMTDFDTLGSGDFCGEELLTWVLDPKPQNHLAISTHSVVAVTEVEAYSLSSDDLKFVASQYRRLFGKQLQHTFRYYSNHWGTWAVCFIQAAWRRYQRRRLAELRRKVEDPYLAMRGESTDKLSLEATILTGQFAKNAMRSVQRLRSMHAAELLRISYVPKPSDPDFTQGI